MAAARASACGHVLAKGPGQGERRACAGTWPGQACAGTAGHGQSERTQARASMGPWPGPA
eukprot:12752475-Alexandrium_andersonii.AAC.1